MKNLKTNFIVKNLIIWRERLFFKPRACSFFSVISQAQKMLVLFPHKREDFAAALNYVSGISNVFFNPMVYVLLPYGNQEGFCSSLKMYEIMSPQKEDITFFSLPKKKFIQKIKSHNFNICVDLDLGFNFFNAYVCLKSEASLRIGIKREKSTPFYNLQIALPKRAVYREDVYFSMLETLKNIKISEDNSCISPS